MAGPLSSHLSSQRFKEQDLAARFKYISRVVGATANVENRVVMAKGERREAGARTHRRHDETAGFRFPDRASRDPFSSPSVNVVTASCQQLSIRGECYVLKLGSI